MESLIQSGLETGLYQCIVLPFEPENRSYFSMEYGTEHLMFLLPENHEKANCSELSFDDINGQNMIVYSQIGFWGDLHRRKMPNSRFLMQNDRFDFQELVNTSVLPAFVSDRTIEQSGVPNGRIAVPISDPEASVTYHLICKRENRNKLQALFKRLT